MPRLRTLLIASSIPLAAFAVPPGDSNLNRLSSKAALMTEPIADNPFFKPSALPFHAPPFDKIKESDYRPAIEEGMRQHMVEVEKIANNSAPPTFKNTLVAMERSGAMLARVMLAFGGVTGANTTDSLQKLQEEVAPKLAAHQDAISLNAKLFHRIESVYNKRASLKLDPESLRLVEVTYRNFMLSGAKLSDAKKAQLKDLNKEESTLSAQFVNKLLAAAKGGALVIDDKSKLAGLSQGDIAAAAQAAKDRKLENKWVLTLQNTTQQAKLQDMSDRATREALYKASWNRTEKGDANDTRELISRLAQLRAQRANLLGFPSYAAWKLTDQMAKTPEAAIAFMQNLVAAATDRAQAEAKDIQSMIDAQNGSFKLEPWDWSHYAEQVRKAKYDLDETQIKPYFEVNTVLQDGLFYAANQLYGISFKERKDIPVYQHDVRVFEVFDKDGSSMALFYFDPFKRDNKNGGAWMDNFVNQSRLMGNKPVIYNVTNFTKPEAGQPALISFDDVTTLFHEFGHGLHGMFANQQYPSLSGTATARDFVEFPSQFNEHWATEPRIFAHYAKHFKTGEPMPQALVDKIKKAATFDKGYGMTEVIAAALLDMKWHSLGAQSPKQDADSFEAQSLKQDKIDLSYVPPRYRSSFFLHIWGNGYAASYYAYLWTQMLSDDGFEWFKEHGGLTRENGDRFRAMVLSRGNTVELDKLYRDFRGKAPSVEPMLVSRGLKAEK
ncbi:MAG: peptidyl-dipeptidase Dcp [Holophagaceae bacterium]|nr:peptidyl-dipeptidase Dcp [Holophagaceae bacterium]